MITQRAYANMIMHAIGDLPDAKRFRVERACKYLIRWPAVLQDYLNADRAEHCLLLLDSVPEVEWDSLLRALCHVHEARHIRVYTLERGEVLLYPAHMARFEPNWIALQVGAETDFTREQLEHLIDTRRKDHEAAEFLAKLDQRALKLGKRLAS